MKSILLFLIRIYQKTISFDHGLLSVFKPYGHCKFYPSCSEYAHRAIEKKGIVKGMALGIHRLARCNPWNPGGIDLVT